MSVFKGIFPQIAGMLIAIALNTIAATAAEPEESQNRARVTGIGGVFFLTSKAASEQGVELSKWYEKHLGMKLQDWGGAVLQWEEDTAEDNGITVWGTASSDSTWFSPSTSRFMINYRVNDMQRLIAQLTEEGIEIIEGPEYAENGVFAWIMDPAGNKVELWEPKLWDDKNKK